MNKLPNYVKNISSKNFKVKLVTLIISSFILVSNVADADIISLDFKISSSIGSVQNSNGTYNYYDYVIYLDTNTLLNTASSNAFNNSPNFSESVSTSMNNYSPCDTCIPSFRFSQTYNQQADLNGKVLSEMSLTYDFSISTYNTQTVNNIYTGNLPTSLIPTNYTSQSIVTSVDTIRLNYVSNNYGATDDFILNNSSNVINIFTTILGQTFSFGKYDSFYCSNGGFGNNNCPQQAYTSSEISGTGILSSVTIGSTTYSYSAVAPVPLPAPFLLFGSALFGFGFSKIRNKEIN